MKWQDVRQQYPQKWVLAEALEAHTTEENRRNEKCMSLMQIEMKCILK